MTAIATMTSTRLRTLPTTPWDALRDMADAVDEEADRKIRHATSVAEAAGGAKHLSLAKQRACSDAGKGARSMFHTARVMRDNAAILERNWSGEMEPLEHSDHRAEIYADYSETYYVTCSCGQFTDDVGCPSADLFKAARLAHQHIREATS